MKVGVLGGTFDPVHNAHLALAQCAQEQLGLAKVCWVPAGEPWRKADRLISPAEDRLAMVRLAIEGNQAFELCTLEVERAGPSYSVETLEELRRRSPGETFVFLMGLDALRDLPNWCEPGRLIQLATLAVAARGAERLAANELDGLVAGLSARVVWLEMPHQDISATELRRRAAAGRSLLGLAPQAVAAYVRERRLYLQE